VVGKEFFSNRKHVYFLNIENFGDKREGSNFFGIRGVSISLYAILNVKIF